jgi:hypothetical protein
MGNAPVTPLLGSRCVPEAPAKTNDSKAFSPLQQAKKRKKRELEPASGKCLQINQLHKNSDGRAQA